MNRRAFLRTIGIGVAASASGPMLAKTKPTDDLDLKAIFDACKEAQPAGESVVLPYKSLIRPITKEYVMRSVEYKWPLGKHLIYDGTTGEFTLE